MCYNPIKVDYHDNYKQYRGLLIHPYNKGRVVPCGKCLKCRERYIESWQVRWREQLKYVHPDSSYMITLTYNDANLPHLITPDGELKSTLDYTDVQKFLKRLRRKQEIYCKKNGIENPPIKYHGAGEYGKNFTKRPHYHILITNVILPLGDLSCKKSNGFAQIWKNGNVDVGTDVTPQTINYILKYTLKTYHSKYKPVKYAEFKTVTRDIYPFGKQKKYPDYINECQYPWVKELLNQNVVIRISTEIHQKTLFRFNPKNSENEYRVSEKAFLSKGIGKEYLTKDVINYYLQNPYAMYDYYDVKKRMVKSRPLPKYYSEMIYNPILKIDGKNQYDENKKPIRLNNIKCFEEYSKTPLFQKQLKNYQSEQIRFNRLLELYNNDIQLLTEQEYIKRKTDQAIQTNRRKNIEELQKHSNYINNLREI